MEVIEANLLKKSIAEYLDKAASTEPEGRERCVVLPLNKHTQELFKIIDELGFRIWE